MMGYIPVVIYHITVTVRDEESYKKKKEKVILTKSIEQLKNQSGSVLSLGQTVFSESTHFSSSSLCTTVMAEMDRDKSRPLERIE